MKFRFVGDADCPDWLLAEIATLSKFSSIRLRTIVLQIIQYCVIGDFNYEKVLKLAADNTEGVSDIKGAIAALHFILTNAAKHDVDDTSLLQEIQQLGLPKENSDALTKQYREHKDAMRARLAEESYKTSKLVETHWRLDHIIASSADSSSVSSTGPSVHLKLVVDNQPHNKSNSSREEILCELTADKLDVLVNELSNATALLAQIQ
jgi:hypothetical protein